MRRALSEKSLRILSADIDLHEKAPGWRPSHTAQTQPHAFLVEPPAPSSAKTTVTKTTIITMLAVSPWSVPMPRSQYQWMPTLGGSPARAGNGTAAAAAAAAAAAGTCTLLEMNAGTQAQRASRLSRAMLKSWDPPRAICATKWPNSSSQLSTESAKSGGCSVVASHASTLR